jgi:hypothetical protein
VAFGAAIALSSCYFGVTVKGGAVGVGRAVNAAVVAAAVSIMLLDFFMTYADRMSPTVTPRPCLVARAPPRADRVGPSAGPRRGARHPSSCGACWSATLAGVIRSYRKGGRRQRGAIAPRSSTRSATARWCSSP